jgi:transcriptional regulator GlxA family with amidase domain
VRIEILLYPGFDELEAIGPYEVLQQASKRGAPFATRLVTLAGAGDVRAANGLWVRAEGRLADSGRPDLLLVPGGGWGARAPQGAWAEAQRPETPAAIRAQYGDGAKLAAVCTGAMLLGAAGLLYARHATTHHVALEELRAQGAQLVDARVVDDGDIITCGGVTSGIDLGLWLVERFSSAELARQVEATLEYVRRGQVWRKPASAAAGGDAG